MQRQITDIFKGFFLIAVLGFSSSYSYAAIYKYTDAQGNTVFSDRPHIGAVVQPIESPPSLSWKKADEKPSAVEKTNKKTVEPLPTIKITAPAKEQYIRNSQGGLTIKVKVKPPLKKGQKLQAILDGSLFGGVQLKDAFTLSGIVRGIHSLEIKLLDTPGKELAGSGKVSFYMHRNIFHKTSKKR